ncbi:MAG: hypothetical protein SFW67_00190 [Myxococcaceae bacterium]|nr:hypothetical protein [Myxococcaceae bacterium]
MQPGSGLKEVGPWLALALGVWAAGLAVQRLRGADALVEPLPSWQQSFRALPQVDQRTFRHLRESLYELERLRVTTGRWPEPALLRDEAVEPFREDEHAVPRTWSLRQHGVYATYVGVPVTRAAGARFVVVYVEPTAQVLAAKEPPPPEDEEHHTLADGTALHVTVWTQDDADEPVPDEVLAFPAAQGWVQRLGGSN